MDEFKEDDKFKWIDPKKVAKDDESLLRTIPVPAEMECFLLQQNQIPFRII